VTAPLKPKAQPAGAVTTLPLEFDDNALVLQLFGSHHGNLVRIEKKLDVFIDARGNQVTIAGAPEMVDTARGVLDSLYGRLAKGLVVGREEVDAAVRMATGNAMRGVPRGVDAEPVIRTRKLHISPRTLVQAAYIRALNASELVFALGPAGTGKTYLAVAKAVEKLINGEVDRIVLSRPAVEAGERLGFLPGDMRDKVDPYLRPLYDALHDMMPAPQVAKRLESGEIEVAPLAFMRGRTLANAFVILDEAQNTTAVQMKMFLTRLGENSRMIVTGDLSQVDLPQGIHSGLREAVEILSGMKGMTCIEFTHADVVRHPLVARIVRAYEDFEARRGSAARYETSGGENALRNE
jgi:phosphate starvation-inducible PhoH-like protein